MATPVGTGPIVQDVAPKGGFPKVRETLNVHLRSTCAHTSLISALAGRAVLCRYWVCLKAALRLLWSETRVLTSQANWFLRRSAPF